MLYLSTIMQQIQPKTAVSKVYVINEQVQNRERREGIMNYLLLHNYGMFLIKSIF